MSPQLSAISNFRLAVKVFNPQSPDLAKFLLLPNTSNVVKHICLANILARLVIYIIYLLSICVNRLAHFCVLLWGD